MPNRASLVLAVVVVGWSAPAPADPLAVVVELDQLTCATPTERKGSNNRDEVYVDVVATKGATAPTKRRLPRSRTDDYYEFWAGTVGADRGFTNRDQIPQGPPQLWEGVLGDGEQVVIVVRVNEQDNKELPLIKTLLLQGLDQAEALAIQAIEHRPGAPPAVPGQGLAELYDRIGDVFAALPGKARDDLIGAFSVTIANTGGKAPLVSWAPLAQLTASTSDATSAAWVADGTGGAKYQLAARVVARSGGPPPEPPLRYVGVETDRCDADTLTIARPGGDAVVRKGDSALVEPTLSAKRRFRWRCGDSDEQSRCRDRDARVLRVLRAREGRRVRWGCFAR